jgi:toxin ParE1/3/4
MENYRLSKNAQIDSVRIHQRGVREHGEKQADACFLAFFEGFEQIAKQPYLYPSVDYIRDGYRHSVCGVDSIFYRIMHDTVEIMAVLGRQDRDYIL